MWTEIVGEKRLNLPIIELTNYATNLNNENDHNASIMIHRIISMTISIRGVQ